MDKNKLSQKKHIPYISRLGFVLCAMLGCVNMAIVALICEYFTVSASIVTVAFTALYLLEILIIGLKRSASSKISDNISIHNLLSEDSSVMLKNSKKPSIVIDKNGTVLWYNDSMREALGTYENYIDKNVSDIFSLSVDMIGKQDAVLKLGECLYSAEGFTVDGERGDSIYILVLNDITALTEVERKYFDERVAVAYIAIDNVEDVLQYVQEKFADAVAQIDLKLKEWARSVNGVIKSYDNDKYIMFFETSYLEECKRRRFDILDEIRDTRVGDGVSITVSIGVSRGKSTLAERELDAKDAIDLALQRGGDQVVYKSDAGTEHFGGRTKTVYKRSNVHSRAFASQLSVHMVRSDNVIVMGHRYGDFDSFGAAIGVARLALLCGSTVNIAVDMRDKNLKPCIDMLQKTDMYSQMFVDNAEGLDLIGPDSIVILVDHNTLSRAQFSDIANKAKKVAIIDHHRKTDVTADVIKLAYIEPSASSTCELVTEMLESAISSQNLLKEEADILLAGILLDTKQFTRNTGTRTFGAAQYLRGAGASPTDVYNLFKTAPEDLAKEARFHTSITMYNENIAISSCDGETDESYRIIASKAADKMLTLKGVDAAFTLVRIGEQIHISGRSTGKINVQLILEKLKGGGHYDVAGAQVTSDSVISVLEMLKSSIDEYLEKVND